MIASLIVAEARRRGILLSADGDQIVYDAPRDAMTPRFRDELVKHKAEVLAMLSVAPAPSEDWRDDLEHSSPAFREFWEERSAIMEFDGELPQDRAEARAYALAEEWIAALGFEGWAEANGFEPIDPDLFDLMDGRGPAPRPPLPAPDPHARRWAKLPGCRLVELKPGARVPAEAEEWCVEGDPYWRPAVPALPS